MAFGGVSWHQYMLKAFTWQWNLLVFGGAVAAALLSGSPDIALPLVLAAEGTYLASMAANPKFRKSVETSHHKAIRASRTSNADRYVNKVDSTLHSLGAGNVDRFIKLRDRCLEMRRIAARVRGDAPNQPMQTETLDRMLWTFLRLLASQEALGKFLRTTDSASLRKRVTDIEVSLKKAKDAGDEKIIRALVDSFATAELRLDNLEKAEHNARFISIELDRIEDKIQVLIEMTVGHEDPDFLSNQVDSVAASMLDTEAAIREMSFVPGVNGFDDEDAPAILTETA